MTSLYFSWFLLFLVALMTKHLIVDFALQTPRMLADKGHLFRLGGYLHAGLHLIVTAALLWIFRLPVWLALFDGVVHYMVDWLKSNAVRRHGLTADRPAYWWLLGLDQYLHWMTYVALALLAIATPMAAHASVSVAHVSIAHVSAAHVSAPHVSAPAPHAAAIAPRPAATPRPAAARPATPVYVPHAVASSCSEERRRRRECQ